MLIDGVGAEGSGYGLEVYTQLKTCHIDWDDKPDLPYLLSLQLRG